MKIKKPIACGLMGVLPFLGGCTDSNENKPREEISQSVTEEKPDWVYEKTEWGFYVDGTFDGVKFDYTVCDMSKYDKPSARLTMAKKDGPFISTIVIMDGPYGGKLDGNVNYVETPLVSFHYNDDGAFTGEPRNHACEKNAQKLREWANTKLKKVQDLLTKEFGDKVKIKTEPVKIETIEDYLKNFEFEKQEGEEGNFEFERRPAYSVLKGKIDGIDVEYVVYDLSGNIDSISLTLTKGDRYIEMGDNGCGGDKVDGNVNAINAFNLINEPSHRSFYYGDDGDLSLSSEEMSAEDANNMLNWANDRFAFIQKEFKERFWDKVEIDEPETIDELLEDFDF